MPNAKLVIRLLRIHPRLDRWLIKQAKAHGISVTEVLRRLIDGAINAPITYNYGTTMICDVTPRKPRAR